MNCIEFSKCAHMGFFGSCSEFFRRLAYPPKKCLDCKKYSFNKESNEWKCDVSGKKPGDENYYCDGESFERENRFDR